LAAFYARDCLIADGLTVDLINLQEFQIQAYPHSEDDPQLKALIERFNTANGWVLATPVYNWGASAVLLNFLHYALDDDPQRRFRPFVLIGGAGGQKSHLALDGLARMMIYEISAIQVGPILLAAGELADRNNGSLAPDLQHRIQRAMKTLAHFTAASATLINGDENRFLKDASQSS
jgi:NAD(P)H-dependent FMN reductase